jgi:hypothetical protein
MKPSSAVGRPSGLWRAARIGAILLATAGSATACGSASTPAQSDAEAGNSSPGTVALEYSKALFAGQFDRAEAWVLPKDRQTLKLISAGLGRASVRQRNLAVGSTDIKGNAGVAVLTGTLCSSGAAPKSASSSSPRPHEQCISNKDVHTKEPSFQLSLCRQKGAWYVCFPRSLSASGTPSSADAESPVP